MFGAILTFLVLFGLLKVFEREREDLDNFSIATVAVVPVLSVVLVSMALGFLYPNPTLLTLLPPLILIGMTFGLLWKNLDIPFGRSLGYTLVVVIVNETLGYFLPASD